jgi:hypothetical protein
MKELVALHRKGLSADTLIFSTSVFPFLVFFQYQEQFGLNPSTIFLMLMAGLAIASLPFQLSRGYMHIMSRLLIIGGALSQSVLVFCKPPSEAITFEHWPMTLLIAGSIVYTKHRTNSYFVTFKKRLAQIESDEPFECHNLMSHESIIKDLNALAKRIQEGGRIRPLILHVPVNRIVPSHISLDWTALRGKVARLPSNLWLTKFLERKSMDQISSAHRFRLTTFEEKPDVMLIGCSLTGAEFIFCGQYTDADKSLDGVEALIDRLTMMHSYLRHGITLRGIDIMALGISRERFTMTLEDSLLTMQMRLEIKERWQQHVRTVENAENAIETKIATISIPSTSQTLQ